MNSEVPPPPPPAAGTQPRTSGLAIASMVLGILSCVCLPAPVAIVLGVVALVQMGKDPNLKGKGFAIAGIVLPLVMAVAVVPAIAIPNFIKFQTKAKQSECRANLKSLAVSQMVVASESEDGSYGDDVKKLGFSPGAGARYSYVVSSNPEAEGGMFAGTKDGAPGVNQIRDALRRPLAGGVQIGLHDGVWTGVCVGNIDSDEDFDVWSVSSTERDGPSGTIPAWEPFNDINDAE